MFILSTRDVVSELTSKEIARWIYDNADSAIYEENGKYHVSSTYFMGVPIRESVLGMLSSFLKKAPVASLLGISQGTDHGIEAITTWLGTKLHMPFSLHTEGDLDIPPIGIASVISHCCVLVAYTSDEQQMMDILNCIEKLGGNPLQLVSLVDEKGKAENVCSAKGINFQKVISLSAIARSLRALPDADSVKVDAILKQLQN
jgi:hypothetical protein